MMPRSHTEEILLHIGQVDITGTYMSNNTIRSLGSIPINLSSKDKRNIEGLVKMLRENRLKYREDFEMLGDALYSVLLKNPIGEKINRILFEYSESTVCLKLILDFG